MPTNDIFLSQFQEDLSTFIQLITDLEDNFLTFQPLDTNLSAQFLETDNSLGEESKESKESEKSKMEESIKEDLSTHNMFSEVGWLHRSISYQIRFIRALIAQAVNDNKPEIPPYINGTDFKVALKLTRLFYRQGRYEELRFSFLLRLFRPFLRISPIERDVFTWQKLIGYSSLINQNLEEASINSVADGLLPRDSLNDTEKEWFISSFLNLSRLLYERFTAVELGSPSYNQQVQNLINSKASLGVGNFQNLCPTSTLLVDALLELDACSLMGRKDFTLLDIFNEVLARKLNYLKTANNFLEKIIVQFSESQLYLICDNLDAEINRNQESHQYMDIDILQNIRNNNWDQDGFFVNSYFNQGEFKKIIQQIAQEFPLNELKSQQYFNTVFEVFMANSQIAFKRLLDDSQSSLPPISLGKVCFSSIMGFLGAIAFWSAASSFGLLGYIVLGPATIIANWAQLAANLLDFIEEMKDPRKWILNANKELGLLDWTRKIYDYPIAFGFAFFAQFPMILTSAWSLQADGILTGSDFARIAYAFFAYVIVTFPLNYRSMKRALDLVWDVMFDVLKYNLPAEIVKLILPAKLGSTYEMKILWRQARETFVNILHASNKQLLNFSDADSKTVDKHLKLIVNLNESRLLVDFLARMPLQNFEMPSHKYCKSLLSYIITEVIPVYGLTAFAIYGLGGNRREVQTIIYDLLNILDLQQGVGRDFLAFAGVMLVMLPSFATVLTYFLSSLPGLFRSLTGKGLPSLAGSLSFKVNAMVCLLATGIGVISGAALAESVVIGVQQGLKHEIPRMIAALWTTTILNSQEIKNILQSIIIRYYAKRGNSTEQQKITRYYAINDLLKNVAEKWTNEDFQNLMADPGTRAVITACLLNNDFSKNTLAKILGNGDKKEGEKELNNFIEKIQNIDWVNLDHEYDESEELGNTNNSWTKHISRENENSEDINKVWTRQVRQEGCAGIISRVGVVCSNLALEVGCSVPDPYSRCNIL